VSCAHRRPRVPEGIASRDALDTPAPTGQGRVPPEGWGVPCTAVAATVQRDAAWVWGSLHSSWREGGKEAQEKLLPGV